MKQLAEQLSTKCLERECCCCVHSRQFTFTLDLPVQACKNASLSLANAARYVLAVLLLLHAVQNRSSAVQSGIVIFTLY